MSPTMLNRAVRASQTRAPRAATQNEVTSNYGLGNYSTGSLLSGDKAWRQGYYANIWVYRCAQVIAEDLSTLPLRVGKDMTQPGEYDTSHPLAILLGPPPGSPNPETSARNLWLWTIVQRLITGAFAWEIEKGPDSGLPMFLWPLPTNRVTPVPTDGGSAYFKGYTVDLGGGKKKNLSLDSVVYDWRPSAEDWRSPESVMRAAQLDISVAAMQDRYDYAFLKNDARPATVVVHEAFQNVDERDAWRQSFVSTHGGPDNAGKVAFAETSPGGSSAKDSMLIQTLGMTSKDAEFIARYDGKLRAIEVAFGVPRSRLGDASARTFANASEEWKGYWQTTIKQLAWEMADAINTKLAPKFGLDVCWFDFSGNPLLRDEPPFPVEQAVNLQRAGLVSTNEVRTKVLYLPPVENGDDMAAQPTLADIMAATPDEEEDEETVEVEEPDNDVPDEDDMDEAGQPVQASKVSLASVRRLHAFNAQRRQERALPPLSSAMTREDRVKALLRSTDRDVELLEKRWQRSWKRFFTRQLDSVTARLEGKRGRQALARAVSPDPTTVFDPVFWQKATLEHATEMYTDILDSSLTAYANRYGISLDLESVWAKDFIAQRSNQLAGQVTKTTYDAIKVEMASGVADGESIPAISKRIESVFGQATKNRATTIARTEVISGYNGGTQRAIQNTDESITAGMEWIAALDDRTRIAHSMADGDIVRVGENFTVDGEELEYPGDPGGSPENVINCRCTVAPVSPEDMPDHTSNRSAEPEAEREPVEPIALTVNVQSGTVKRMIDRDAEGRIVSVTEVTE